MKSINYDLCNGLFQFNKPNRRIVLGYIGKLYLNRHVDVLHMQMHLLNGLIDKNRSQYRNDDFYDSSEEFYL